jgi:hypothetical protein
VSLLDILVGILLTISMIVTMAVLWTTAPPRSRFRR